MRNLRRGLQQRQHLLWVEADRARRDLESTMDRARRVVEDEQPEFLAMMEEARRRMERLKEGGPGPNSPRKRPRRRPRKPRGGEPAPVEPRPKPKPLVDGAEAPIE